jgi:hypothetical protein
LSVTIQGAKELNRQGAKGAKEDAKKEFLLCRVDGKAKGFALRRGLYFLIVQARFRFGRLAVKRACHKRDRHSLSWSNNVRRNPVKVST